MASNRENLTLTPQHSHWSQTALQANYWNGYAAAQSAVAVLEQSLSSTSQTSSVPLHCNDCNMSFRTDSEYSRHCQSHKKYTFDGTDESSLRPQMKFDLNTPEAIERWIAERRKNYPTAGNIARKKAEMEERMARGELIENRRSLPNKRSQSNQTNVYEGYYPSKRARVDFANSKYTGPKSWQPEYDATKKENGQNLRENVNNNDTNGYGRGKFCKRTDTNFGRQTYGRPWFHRDNRNYASSKIYGPTYDRPNLLNQLLARDIHREKSAILQCFRHIITQNFFGVIPDNVIEENKRRGPSIVMYGNSSSDTESGTENEIEGG